MMLRIRFLASCLTLLAAGAVRSTETALEIAGLTVTPPHVRAESMRYRRPPEPEMAARAQLFIRNASPSVLTIPPDTDHPSLYPN